MPTIDKYVMMMIIVIIITRIFLVSYSEQLRKHWTRSKQREANATVWQSRQGPRKEVRF